MLDSTRSVYRVGPSIHRRGAYITLPSLPYVNDALGIHASVVFYFVINLTIYFVHNNHSVKNVNIILW